MSWSDPQYCYLLNGLNIANGTGDIGHVDHPGTPVQLFAALIIKITSFFRKTNDITNDVLRHPETYLFIISQCILLMISLLIFILGKVVFIKTNQPVSALFFQTSTLFSFVISMYLPNLMTEPFIVMCGLAMLLFYIKFVFEQKANETPFAIIFGMIAGLSMAVKFSSFPALVIPLILLTQWKDRIFYSITSVVSFIFCTLPIFNKYVYFFDFIKGVFTHTGKYGTGKNQFIESSLFFENLYKIFSAGPTFTMVLCLSLFVLLLTLFNKLKFTEKEKPFQRLLTGIFFACIIQILVVAKHYSYHYLIPVHIYSIASLYLIYMLTKNYFSGTKFSFLHSYLVTKTLFISFFVLLFLKTIFIYGYFENAYNPRRTTYAFLEKYKQIPRLVVAENTGATPEPAMYFGYIYSGNGKQKYATYLSDLYKNSFLYLLYDSKIRNFTEELTVRELAQKSPQWLVYFSQQNDSIVKSVLNQFDELNKNSKIITSRLLFTHPGNKEKIYLLRVDTMALRQSIKTVRSITCTMEWIKDDVFLSTDSLYTFKGAFLRSNEKAYRGKHSAKFTPELIFGLDIPLRVKAGRTYEISVLRNSDNGKGALVVSAKNTQQFYLHTDLPSDANKEWKTLRLNFTVPPGLNDSILSIYLWNNGNGDVWFDDLRIVETE